MKYRDFIRGGPTPGEAGEAEVIGMAPGNVEIKFSGFSIIYDEDGKIIRVVLIEKS